MLERTVKSLKTAIGHTLVPAARLYVRYAPGSFGRRWVLDNFAFRSRPVSARTFYGATLTGTTEDFIHRNVYFFGAWEPHLTYWIQHALKPGEIFVDVGANVGYFSLLASRLVGPEGRVIAIEASPRICAMLKANIAADGARNIEVHGCAASDSRGIVSVFQSDESNIARTTIRPGKDYTQHEAEIQSLPLEDIVGLETLSRARMIKIDVEGAEWGVIKGIEDFLRNGAPDNLEVAVEISPDDMRDQGVDPASIFDIFLAGGFRAYRLANSYEMHAYSAGTKPPPPEECPNDLDKMTDVLFLKATTPGDFH